MKITKNERGGFTFDGSDNFILSKKPEWIEIEGINNSDFTNFRAFYNVKESKIKVIIEVIKWLFKK